MASASTPNRTPDTPPPQALAGVRVLELGSLIAGPYAAALLAQFGAEVIKIESPEGGDPLRQWRKLHIGIDAQTLEIRAIEVTPNSVGDAPVLPSLLGQIDPHEALLSVSGDGAYDTKACHEAIALRAAQAIIPVRKNARKTWKENRPGARARNEILRVTQRLGRDIWKRWSGYHRRSLVETKMRCVKLMGERVNARDFDRQVAELQVRAAILNRFTQLGRPTTVFVTTMA